MRRSIFRAMLLAGTISVSMSQAVHAEGVEAGAVDAAGEMASFAAVDGQPAASATDTSAQPAASDAAEGQGADEAVPGDIVVTARRANESLQRVPVAVTAISADTLAKNNIYDAYGVMQKAPGVQAFTRNVANPGALGLVRIRGVAPPSAYFNDVPMPGLEWSLFASFFDVSNIQVLKGPQGTLFGQASNAGAVLNTPRKPGEEFGGYVKASLGNYNMKSVEGALDIPLVPGSLFLRIAGIAYSRDGYIKDSLTDTPVDAFSRYEVGRGTLVWKPSSVFENETMLQVQRVHDLTAGSSGAPGDYNFYNNALNQRLATLNGMTLAEFSAVRDRILANQEVIGPYRTQGWSIGCPATDLRPATSSTVPGPNLEAVVPQPCGPGGGWLHSNAFTNTTTWDIGGGLTLKNIVGHWWGKQKYPGLYDNDGTRLIGNESNPRNLSYVNPTTNVWSEELRVNGEFGDFDFVAGGFYYREKLKQKNPVFGAFTTSLAQGATRTTSESRSRAIYAQGNYDLSSFLSGVKITAGIRKTWDAAYRQQDLLNPTTLALVSSNGGRNTPTGEAHWSSTSYTLGLQYDVSPTTMVYLNNSKGSSSGGLQNNAAVPRFDPDSLNNIEAGLKTSIEAGDFRARINAAAYYGWYSNVKVTTALNLPIAPGSSANALVISTFNVASARIKGFEVETAMSFGDVLDITAFAAYQDPKYKRFPYVNPLTNVEVNLVDQPIPLSPTWKLGISPTVHLIRDQDGIGDISIGADVQYRTKYYQNPVKPVIPNDPSNPDTGLICSLPRTAANGYGPLSADGKIAYKTCAPSLYNVNMHIDWDHFLGNEGLKLRLTVTNVTANSRPAAINSQYDTLNSVGYQANEPRMIYGTISYAF